MPKKKLAELKEINAKVEKFQPSTLDQIFGATGNRKYGTSDPEEYAKTLKGMNKSDLHAHARAIGFMPDDNYDLLVRKLKQEFLTYVNGFKMPLRKQPTPIKPTDAVTKILAEGR